MSARRTRGFSLIEVIVLIVVMAVAAVGVLLVFQTTVRASADPQVQKQALAIAEAMLDEILLTSYDSPLPGTGARANFDDVDDYNLYSTTGGMKDIQNNPITGLEQYNVTGVTVTVVSLNDTPASLTAVTEVKRITVSVSGPGSFQISLDGYRVRYAAP